MDQKKKKSAVQGNTRRRAGKKKNALNKALTDCRMNREIIVQFPAFYFYTSLLLGGKKDNGFSTS